MTDQNKELNLSELEGHTEGPWKFDDHAGCRDIKGGKRGAGQQAQYSKIAFTTGLSDDEKDKANAAPTLLSELKEARELADNCDFAASQIQEILVQKEAELKEARKEIERLKINFSDAQLEVEQKHKIELSNYAYQIDSAKRERDQAEADLKQEREKNAEALKKIKAHKEELRTELSNDSKENQSWHNTLAKKELCDWIIGLLKD